MWSGQEKTYLGDGAYLSYDGYHLVLTTEDGISVQNIIYLEPQVYKALVRAVQSSPHPGIASFKENPGLQEKG